MYILLSLFLTHIKHTLGYFKVQASQHMFLHTNVIIISMRLSTIRLLTEAPFVLVGLKQLLAINKILYYTLVVIITTGIL